MACSGTVYNMHVLHHVVRGIMEQNNKAKLFWKGQDTTI